eukprot:CAMPEP_0173347558 /NCGR_PEP_ID=MMETSP1144-20121109/13221_1 /TAXON_ID=483371 /ORGANISM="non described non described, Strain CCMP2298" /LENGTH=130 /DNA_ID=CAMNT_0014295059 /DNA_START=11 /DNA_END=403 /DNA_ORIENTATION=-
MSLYEGIARAYLSLKSRAVTGSTGGIISSSSEALNADALSSIEAGAVGLASGIVTAVVTCPIDVVNTRIKSGEINTGIIAAHLQIIRQDGAKALFRGLVPRGVIMGLGSTVFWYLQATVMAQLQRADSYL